MPLKEIAVTPIIPNKEPNEMEELELFNDTNNKENSKETSEKQKPLANTNAAFAMDPNGASSTDPNGASSTEQTDSDGPSQTTTSKDIQTVAMFTVSSVKNDMDSDEHGKTPQGMSKPGMLMRQNSTQSSVSIISTRGDICRICHCEGDEESPLVTPCLCLGSLKHVHQACIQQWIKSSNTKCCELCRFPFVMQTKLKPIGKWERLDMTTSERRKMICSVSFHVIAITCVVWALYVLIDRTTIELQSSGITQWPFWTKLVVVAIGFTGGLIFMYVQCKVYLHLWQRLKAYNRVIYVQNCPPEERLKVKQAKSVPEPLESQVEIIS